MSSAELRSPPREASGAHGGATATISGFGRTRPVAVTLLRPRDAREVAELLAGAPSPPRGLIARGAGLSYGDPAQNEGGLVLDTAGLAGVHAIDERSGDVTVGAGTRVADLMRALARSGLTLPVVPGTSALTVGGAIACDAHGKNHPHAGSFGAHVRSLSLVTPAQGQLEVTRETDGELFAATLGGIGLTGVITAATLATEVRRTPCAVADVDRVGSIEEAIELIASTGDRHTHAIAWLDLLARDGRFTRAVVTRSREGERAAGAGELDLPEPRFAFAPPLLAPALPLAVRAFNAANWLRSPRHGRGIAMDAGAALFPLDAVAGWNRAYGRAGLLQYQAAVPAGEEPVLRAILDLLRSLRVPMYLCSLKRLGPAGVGMLSFPIEGWTLAVDIPARADGLAEALDRADRLVADAGGRVYLAKDARLAPEMLGAMYPQLSRFGEVRARVDPHELLRSDMSRRLGLTR